MPFMDEPAPSSTPLSDRQSGFVLPNLAAALRVMRLRAVNFAFVSSCQVETSQDALLAHRLASVGMVDAVGMLGTCSLLEDTWLEEEMVSSYFMMFPKRFVLTML